jgi:hypothetical protein
MSLFKKIFSKIFEKVERRLMGLQEAGSCGGLLSLGIRITTEYF